MKIGHLMSAAGIVLLAGGCGITSDVYAVVGDGGEVFTGTVTSHVGSEIGTIQIANGKGTTCIGDFLYSGMTSGHGLLSCSDGVRARIQFTSAGLTSAYGFGTSTGGKPIRFTVGMSPDERAKYIGASATQAPATPGNGPPAAPSAAGAVRTIATGTGFFITSQGHFVTNAHVIKTCNAVTATLLGGTARPATVVRSDTTNDLAVLTISAAPPAVAALRSTPPVRQGDAVVSYGFPLSDTLSSGGVTTNGTVSALAGVHDDTRYLQFSAPAQPGNSGGPLLDMSGAVVGVVTAGLRPEPDMTPQNVNFALKVDVVRTFLGAVGIAPETSPAGPDLDIPDVVERARAFTVFVECKG